MAKPHLSNADAVCRAPVVVEGDWHCWSLSRPHMRVEMHAAAIYSISHDLRRETGSHEWPAGLLLGKIKRLDTGTVSIKITRVEPCDFRDLDSLLLNSELVLGFYRITGQEEFAFSDRDLTLARWRFPDPDSIFLFVRASGLGQAEARFCYWNAKGIVSEESEFPTTTRWSFSNTPLASRPAAVAEPPGPEPSAKARILGCISSVAARVRRSREASSIEAPAPSVEPELNSQELSESVWARLGLSNTPDPSGPPVMPEPPSPEDPAKARILGVISSIAARVRRSREASSIEAPAPSVEPELNSPELSESVWDWRLGLSNTPAQSRPPVTPEPPSPEHLAKARILGVISSVAARVRRSREAFSIQYETAPVVEPEMDSPESSESAWSWRQLAIPAILLLPLVLAVALVVAAVKQRAPDNPVRLDLTTSPVGSSLRVSWTKGAPVASASEGLLSISDGEQKQELNLNSKQLHEETVVYMPTSGSVSFTLQVFADGVIHRDSITVRAPVPPSPPATIPAEPQRPVLNPPALPSARPERVARALPQPRIESPAARTSVAANRESAKPEPSSIRAEPAVTSPLNQQAVPEPVIAVSSPDRRREIRISPQPTPPPPPRPQPAARVFIPPTAPTSVVAARVAAPAPPAARHIPPQAVRQVKPIVPRTLKALISREIVMDVTLSIDEAGKVIKADPSTGPGVLQTSLGKLAADAARHWKFEPAHLGNLNVPGEVRVQFQFGPGN